MKIQCQLLKKFQKIHFLLHIHWLVIIIIILILIYNYKMSRQYTIEKETFWVCNVWLLEICRCWSMHTALTLYSHSHMFLMFTRLIWLGPSEIQWMQQNFQEREDMSWNLSRLHQTSRTLLWIIPNLFLILSDQRRLLTCWAKLTATILLPQG